MIQYDNTITLHQFLVADIGEDNLILGYPFFETANPVINWKKGTLPKPITLSVQKDWTKGENETWFHQQIAKVTMAQQLAEQATDKKERTWDELVPKQYHVHEKVFSE
jgi:hypothetical protein